MLACVADSLSASCSRTSLERILRSRDMSSVGGPCLWHDVTVLHGSWCRTGWAVRGDSVFDNRWFPMGAASSTKDTR